MSNMSAIAWYLTFFNQRWRYLAYVDQVCWKCQICLQWLDIWRFLTNGEDISVSSGWMPPTLCSRTIEDVDLLIKFKCAGNAKICLQKLDIRHVLTIGEDSPVSSGWMPPCLAHLLSPSVVIPFSIRFRFDNIDHCGNRKAHPEMINLNHDSTQTQKDYPVSSGWMPPN